MLECLLLGDSIAVGIAQRMPECQVQATVGIGSAAFAQVLTPKDAKVAVISLGSNDDTDPTAELTAIRAALQGKARKVIWIIPGRLHAKGRNAVGMVATAYRDEALLIPDYAQDRTHPTTKGYESLANSIRGMK